MRLLLFFGLWSASAVLAANPQQTLDGKLHAQWKKFGEARAFALVQSETRAISREEWEKLIALETPFTPEELKSLRSWQQTVITQAKERNQKSSVINLDALRQGAPERVKQFCADLPKGGQLHLHDWGTMSENGMADLLSRLNPLLHPLALHDELKPSAVSQPGFNRGSATLYPTELAFLQGLAKRYGKEVRYASLRPIDQAKLRDLMYLPAGTHPFSRFEAVFLLEFRLILEHPTIDVNRLLWDDYFSRAQTENVLYAEVSEPGELTPEGMKKIDAWSADLQHRFGILAKSLHAFFRAWTPAELGKETQKLLSIPPANSLAGVNLVNNEKDAPALEKGLPIFIPLLKAARESRTRLHRAFHAGEAGDPRNVRDALILGAERVGHGIALREDPVTLEYARLHEVPIETNLTSNVRLGVVKSYREHPFLNFLRLGLKVSLSTDDEGIFGTDINRECQHAISDTDLNYTELREMIRNSIGTSFASDEEKAALNEKLSAQLEAFEGRWKKLTH